MNISQSQYPPRRNLTAVDDPPPITILLLGDPDCGKSTFLSSLSHSRSVHDTSPLLRDLDQPFVYNITSARRVLRLEFCDTSSPENYTLLTPNVIILCYAVNDRVSLRNTQLYWKKEAMANYRGVEEKVPLMLLGLKRDLRVEGEGIVDPHEGYRYAQEMRCDKYAECSAATGELMKEVMEDIVKTAVKTTKTEREEDGGMDGGCVVS